MLGVHERQREFRVGLRRYQCGSYPCCIAKSYSMRCAITCGERVQECDLAEDDSVPEQKSQDFVRLMMLNERKLFSYILSLVPNWSDADEILQGTALRLWEGFDKYEEGTQFLAWARRVAYYEILSHRKRSQRSRLIFSPELLQTLSEESQELDLEADERMDALKKCLDSLSKDSKKLLAMYYAEESKMEDVARQLGRTLAAAYQALYRVRLGLRNCIAKRLSGS